MAFLCFLIPANPKDLKNSRLLMSWRTVQEKVPWGVFLLMGGAFAMASGIGVFKSIKFTKCFMKISLPSILY